MEKQKGYIVNHTHWDREWRYPIWENRMYLVRLMDELLETLDNNEDYNSFILDGQSVIIEDYLEVRPDKREKAKKYIKQGKISIGPWYTLPDLYPVDGEALVRNLLKGIRYSTELGGYLNVAYESFGWGQISQFPQIYKSFGLDVCIVAKNVSKERAPQSEFMWEGADGTKLLSTRLGQHGRANFFMNAYLKIMTGKDYLSDDYRLEWDKAGTLFHLADAKNFHNDYHRLENTEKLHRELVKDAVQVAWDAAEDTVLKSHRLLMNGSDSTTAQPMITEIIKAANELFDDKKFVFCKLENYLKVLTDNIDQDKLTVVHGELRDGPATSCSANALMTRPALKALNKRVQNSLLRCAEPLSVIGDMVGVKYDKQFLDLAIKYMLLSHPHDSINGVTQDKTANDVEYLMNQALEIAETVANNFSGEIIKNINLEAFEATDIALVLINPLPYARNEVVKVYIDTPREYNIWSLDVFDQTGNKLNTQFISRQESLIPVSDLHCRPLPFYADRHCMLVEVGNIPAGGYKVLKLVKNSSFNRNAVFWPEMRKNCGENISKSPNALENEFIKAEVNSNGTISILDKISNKFFANLNYFEDTGDCGDYWIYYPPYNNKTFTSLGCNAKIWCEENGELAATIAVEISMMLPSCALKPENAIVGESKRSEDEREVKITIRYTLKRGSKGVDVSLTVDNTVEDHRLRVLFDTETGATFSDAAGHFTVDRRPIGGYQWPEMQTLPQQSFVDLSNDEFGLAILNNCLTEFEAIGNDKSTVALTLLRGVRNIICTEFRSAGVFPHEKGGQSLGIRSYKYSIYPHKGSWEQAGVYQAAESLNVPVKLIQTGKHTGGDLPLEVSFFSVEPSGLIMSALKKSEDRESFIIRVFNPEKTAVDGTIKVHKPIKQSFVTNLNEERQGQAEILDQHTIKINVPQNKIVTLELLFEDGVESHE